jgi:hypothetical protein
MQAILNSLTSGEHDINVNTYAPGLIDTSFRLSISLYRTKLSLFPSRIRSSEHWIMLGIPKSRYTTQVCRPMQSLFFSSGFRPLRFLVLPSIISE